VFRSDIFALGCGGVRWLRDLALGGLIGGGTVPSLLDAAPLRAHIAQHLPVEGIISIRISTISNA